MNQPNGNALTSHHSPWWAKMLDRFGVPTVFLGVVLWFGYQMSIWLGEHIIVPVTNGHVTLLKSVVEGTEKQTLVLEEINTTNKAILKQSEENGKQIETILRANQ